MSDGERHEPNGTAIGFGAALIEQIRWFWHRQWVWIAIVTVLTSVAGAWIVASLPEDAQAFAFLIVGNAFHPLLVLIALSWSLSTWRDDPPKDRQYFWLHPVERTVHTVARSLAGFAWLLVVVAVVIGILLAAIVITQGGDAILGTPRFWLYVAGAIALAYIASSIAAILSDRPGLWLVVVIALVIILGVVANIRNVEWLKDILAWFQGGPRSFGAALSGPGVEAARVMMEQAPPGTTFETPGMDRVGTAEPGTALLIWLPIATVAWLGAARVSRPR